MAQALAALDAAGDLAAAPGADRTCLLGAGNTDRRPPEPLSATWLAGSTGFLFLLCPLFLARAGRKLGWKRVWLGHDPLHPDQAPATCDPRPRCPGGAASRGPDRYRLHSDRGQRRCTGGIRPDRKSVVDLRATGRQLRSDLLQRA